MSVSMPVRFGLGWITWPSFFQQVGLEKLGLHLWPMVSTRVRTPKRKTVGFLSPAGVHDFGERGRVKAYGFCGLKVFSSGKQRFFQLSTSKMPVLKKSCLLFKSKLFNLIIQQNIFMGLTPPNIGVCTFLAYMGVSIQQNSNLSAS